MLQPPLALLRRFLFKHSSTTELYTLSLHDALPICCRVLPVPINPRSAFRDIPKHRPDRTTLPRCSINSCGPGDRSEEHTFELQSHSDLVCRLLLEKKKHQR